MEFAVSLTTDNWSTGQGLPVFGRLGDWQNLSTVSHPHVTKKLPAFCGCDTFPVCHPSGLLQIAITAYLAMQFLLLAVLFYPPFSSSNDVNFKNIPNCARKSCFPFHSISIGCQSLTVDCFCNALAPINCANNT